MSKYDTDFNGDLIQTRAVLDQVIAESRDLYEQLRHDKTISAALRKRILGLFTNATLKMLARVEQLSESDGIMLRIATQQPEHEVTHAALTAIKAYIEASRVQP